MRVALVQKCPSTVDYEKHFKLQGLEVFNLCSVKSAKVLKRDIDLIIVDGEQCAPEDEAGAFYPANFDWIILVGTEAVNMFCAKGTSVTSYVGKVAPGKNAEKNFIVSINPAMLKFKPEAKPVFDQAVLDIHDIISGKGFSAREGVYQYFSESKEFAKYLKFILDNPQYKYIGLDSETSALAARDGYLLGVSVSHDTSGGVYAHADCIDEQCIQLLQMIIDEREPVLHNAKFDMHFLKYHLGLQFLGRTVHDTMILHYILDERKGHGLKPLTMKYGNLGDYDRELDEFKKAYCKSHGIKQEQFSYDLIPWDIIKLYAAKDTEATLTLFEKFYPLVQANLRLLSLYHELMLPAMHFLTKIEDRGVPMSSLRLAKANEILDKEITEIKEKLYSYQEVKQMEEINGSIFNPNSPKQLRILLFDVIGMTPTGKLTDTGAISTDADVLMELGQLHEIPELIGKIRKVTKLKSTYVSKLILALDKDSRVRTGFNLTTTTSGRLSSSGKFNMQQLPRDNPLIKGCVKAPPGYKIVAVDLATAEVYYAAVLSGDINMQLIFKNMKKDPAKYPDFHSTVAHAVFNLDCLPEEVKDKYPALRQAAKAITFGILYGSGPASVAESVNEAFLERGQDPSCTTEDAKGYISDYYDRFPQLKKWIDKCHTEIKTQGFIYSHFGRKRRLHNINSIDRGVAAGEVRSGFNAIIQSVSSDHLLFGAMEADDEIMEKELDAEIFALVHDSIVAVVREDLVDEYLEIVIRNIQKDRGCSIKDCPISVTQDSEEGGSADYSCGKLEKMYPEVASL